VISRIRSELVAIGVTEREPPELPWRPLRLVYRDAVNPDIHLWATHEDDRRVAGYTRPAADFDEDCSQGFAARLPTELRVGESQRVVRVAGGTYVTRSVTEIAQDRRQRERITLSSALEAIERGDLDTAKDLLDQALILGTNPPFAAVLRRGLAEELPRDDPWGQAVIEEYAVHAGRLEIEIVARSLWWEDLPAQKIRTRYLQHAYAALARSDEPENPPRAPVASHYFKEAAYINTAMRLGRLKLRLRHQEVALLLEGNPSTIDQVADRLQHQLHVGTREALMVALKTHVHDNNKALWSSFYARARTTDLTFHAALMARLEATLGEATRANCWRAGVRRLNRIKLAPRLIPWQQGQTAAEVFRAEWQMGESPIPTLLGLFRERFGWATFSTDLCKSEYDSFHVVKASAPPTSYLDPEVARTHGPARFAVAKALGMYLLSRVNDGRWFSRRPDSYLTGEATETEQAANSFAAYLLAPQHAVRDATRNFSRRDRQGYQEAVRATVDNFGMSVSASFVHVANCHQEEPPFHWRDLIIGDLRHTEQVSRVTCDTLADPVLPSGVNIPLERADVFARLVARGIATGVLAKNDASELLGSSNLGDWLELKLSEMTPTRSWHSAE